MNITQVYNLIDAPINAGVFAVDNPFIRQLAYLSQEQAKNLKVTSLVLKNALNNRGELAKRGIHSQDKSVIDLSKLTPLVDQQNFQTLQEEVAYVRNWQLQLHDTKDSPTWWREHQEMLMVDYLLASSLCLVEIFDEGSRVDKYFATRNRFLAGELAGLAPKETQKYGNYLQAFSQNYETKQLKALKIGVTKEKYRITQPRSFIDFNRPIKITPLFFMTSFAEGIKPSLETGVIKFSYLKDNLTLREFITTTNVSLLTQVYGTDIAQKMIRQIGARFDRGYLKLPEYGISKYDDTGVRALNLSRIVEVEVLHPNQVDLSFIDVDFDLIIPNIMRGIYDIQSLDILKMIYSELSGQEAPQINNVPEMQLHLEQFIDMQHLMGTTTALRHMHKYMEARSNLFPNYNGGRPVQYGNAPTFAGVSDGVSQPPTPSAPPIGNKPIDNPVVFGQPTGRQPEIPTKPKSAVPIGNNPLEGFGVATSPLGVSSLPTPGNPEPTKDTFGTSFVLGGAVED